MIKIPPAAVHQTGDQSFSRRPGAGHGAAEGAGAVVQIDRFVTVILNQTLHRTGDGIKGLFPADGFEFAFAAFTHALHRLLQAIRIVDAAAHRAATQAGANLM